MLRFISKQGFRRGFAAFAVTMMLVGCAVSEPRQFVIFFGTDDDSLTPAAQQLVAEIAAAARDQHSAKMAVAGYGDGATARDAALGDRRATTVVRALAAAGVEPSSIEKRPAVAADQATGIPVHKVTVTLDPR
jgi:outer membrane protein OmpA-like peptidoglycan-associated protein